VTTECGRLATSSAYKLGSCGSVFHFLAVAPHFRTEESWIPGSRDTSVVMQILAVEEFGVDKEHVFLTGVSFRGRYPTFS
jgi:hypothetical protein